MKNGSGVIGLLKLSELEWFSNGEATFDKR